jgi:HEAT repeat protein
MGGHSRGGPAGAAALGLMKRNGSELDSLLGDLNSGDDRLAERAVHRLALHGESVLPSLLSQLSSSDPDQRWWATAALAQIDHHAARRSITHSLSDQDVSVRQCAAFALRKQPSKDAVPALIASLADSDRLLARLAGDALAALGDQAVSPLTEALRDANPAVRIEAARALAAIDDPAVIAPLFSVLDDSSALVVHWAELGLQRLGVGMVFYQP